ncbi:MAG: hypothetical protein V1874_16075 [Spirochaetota bacterium]
MFNTTDLKYDNSGSTVLIEDIETDVYYDINNLLYNKTALLYKKDKSKCHGNNIDIIYPRYMYPEHKTILKGPDYIRFLLSLYPVQQDLIKVQTIILRPRYIEIDGIELVSLYIRKEKIIVLYLHQPHLYHANNFKFSGYNDLIYSGILGSEMQENCAVADNYILRIPPLWYILSSITHSSDDKIEKFLIKRDVNSCHDAIRKISDISFLYSRLGY